MAAGTPSTTSTTTTTTRPTAPARTRRRIDVLGVGVDAQDLGAALETIGSWVDRRDPHYVCVTGVHGVMACQEDPELLRIHRDAGMVTSDGMPLVWLCRRRGAPAAQRVYGPDLMLAAFERSEQTGWRHFLYGSSPGTLQRLEASLAERFPRAAVVGTYSPPFRPLTPDESREVDRAVAVSGADIVWVGLSTPTQERWMAEHVGRTGAPVLVGVGAAFDFHAGTKRQAPPRVQRMGLEWAYRLACEPRRLAGRYLRNNPRFVAEVVRDAARRLRATAGPLDAPTEGRGA